MQVNIAICRSICIGKSVMNATHPAIPINIQMHTSTYLQTIKLLANIHSATYDECKHPFTIHLWTRIKNIPANNNIPYNINLQANTSNNKESIMHTTNHS
ncbi:hypothetical protein KFK09_022666 [Dendrobium nobile]|uniref:Uncharacterized protein n=1 Tax=Dendrobium nobile TaxID=94219 RepID=A0A8T3AJS3_DENNO|nr:hypothetical protein KFK09_022666 [Dendrobium nobile]